MKVKMLVSDYGIKEGDIVSAKYFKDISDEEKEMSINDLTLYNPSDIFIDIDGDGIYDGFMFDDEVEIIESEE